MFGLGKYTIAAAAIGGLLAGAAAAGFATKLTYDNLVIPELKKAADEAKAVAVADAKFEIEQQMTAAIKVAAATAKAAEKSRLEKIHNQAINEYRSAVLDREAELEAMRREQIMRDISHAKKLAETGRACLLDDGDIDYLTGLHNRSAAAPD